MATKAYALPIAAHKRHGIDVADICWGSCGKGAVAGIVLDNDEAIPCLAPAAECPHFDKEMDKPIATDVEFNDFGPTYDLYLRKLKAVLS
jgi:hypothetical protein